MKEIKWFSKQMQMMRDHLHEAEKFEDYKYVRERCFLTATELYSAAVERLAQSLSALDLRSKALRALRLYVGEYVVSNAFHNLSTQTHELVSLLSTIRYGLLIRDGCVTIRHCDSGSDYSTTIEKTFGKFRANAAPNYWVERRKSPCVNHIEAQIQARVALLYPDTFRALDAFCLERVSFLDAKIARFDREVQFYVAYLSHIDKFRQAGKSFCLPEISSTSKEIRARDTFDLALAGKLATDRVPIIPNDFHLEANERIFVVSGPNHGGKTTFARMFGQLHYLASLGCPVPGKEARLLLFDRLFTHFEREEDIKNLRGKLQDDLLRIREILTRATSNSIIVMNEVFSSTTLKDAVQLSRKVMTRISDLDVLAVWVTFLDELASFNEKTVSIVATVDPHNPATRTFKLERRPADGLAYALAVAEKHRVTYGCLKERIKP
jgi:DNA mismatch repair protein MutS